MPLVLGTRGFIKDHTQKSKEFGRAHLLVIRIDHGRYYKIRIIIIFAAPSSWQLRK